MKARKFLSAILAFVMIITPMLAFSASADDNIVIAFNEPAIPATVGETVNLSHYTVELKAGTASNVTFKNGDNEITEFTPSEAGVTVLTATDGTTSKNVYVVAKNADDSDYVLYFNGFDDEASLAELTPVGASNLHTVKDGNLNINAYTTDSYRLLLPEWLGDFGNYRIEMCSAILKSKDTARWQSIMFRIQGNNYPYYQMCIRQNAATSNGVEFAVRTPNNAWDVQTTGSYLYTQSLNKYYTHSVEAKNNIIKESINNTMCVWSSTTKTYQSGRIGIQANYCEINVDYIKVTLQLNTPERPKADSVTVPSAETVNIMNSVANVAIVDTKEVLDNLSDAHTAILFVSGDNIVDKNGETLFELSKLYDNIGNSIIPSLYLNTTADADSVIAFVKTLKNNTDFTIISADPDVVKYAHQKNTKLRGVIDLSEKYTSLLTAEDISELRLTVNSSLAKSAILSIDCLDKETVLQLQSLNVNVWATKKDASVTDCVKLLVSGANAVVTNAPQSVAAAYTYFDTNAMTRTPLIIGHRGNPTNAPENSISSYLTAWKNGADVIETDIYLSKDGEIVIMHDSDITRTTDGSGNIENMTVEQLQQYHVWGDGDAFKSQFPDEVIPTLREMFEALKDTDAKIFIEIKSGKAAICQKLADLVEEYDFSERVCVISFSGDQLKNLQKVAPQITCGYLLSAPGSSNSPEEAGEQLYKILNTIQPYNTSYNPSYSNQSEAFIDACTARGVAVWPWTYSSGSKEAFCNAFRWGYNGLTTNDCQLTANTVRIINANLSDLELKAEDTAEIEVNARTYGRVTTNVASKAQMVVIEGDGIVSYNNGVITAESEGTAVVMFKYTATLIDGSRYSLYTSPVTINVEAVEPESSVVEESEASVEPEESSTADESVDNSTENNNNSIIWIIVTVAVVAVIGVAIAVIVKKLK